MKKHSIKRKNGSANILILVFILGVLTFILINSFLPFKDKLFSLLYPKSPSSAAVISNDGFSLDTPITQTVNQQFKVRIFASSDTQNSNLFSARITFPQNLINVVSIDNTNSFITTLWGAETFDNATGQLIVVGGVPSPGYMTTAGSPSLFATITFNAIAPGSGSITFNPDTSIFANSNNQDILISNSNASLTINPLPTNTPTITLTPTPTNTPNPKKGHNLNLTPTPTPTPSVLDTQSPSVPTGLSATPVSSSQINLAWNSSTDNVGVKGYDIFRNNILIAQVSTTSFGDTGLNPVTTYSYTVASYDQASNFSAQSNIVSATTLTQATNTGNITGVVTSSSNGTVLPNVKICILISQNGKCNNLYPTVYSSTSGKYTITNITTGTYYIQFVLKNHKTQTLSATVISGQTITLNVSM